LVTSQLPSY